MNVYKIRKEKNMGIFTSPIVSLLIGILAGSVLVVLVVFVKNNHNENKANKFLEDAKKEADKHKRDTLLELKEESYRLKKETDKEIKEKKQEIALNEDKAKRS